MSLQRTFRPLLASRAFVARPAFARVQARFAGDYGSGEGSPVGEDPQSQGKNPMEKMEHPGPPPPDVGKHGGGGGASKGSSGGQQEQQPASSGGSGSGSSSGSQSSKGTSGAQPKILNEAPLEEGQQSEDVAKHNRDMDNRAEQAHEKVRSTHKEGDETVGKEYWKAPDEHSKNPVQK